MFSLGGQIIKLVCRQGFNKKRKMKVIYSIKVHRDNLKTLQGLKCLQSVESVKMANQITCQFKDNKTRGCLIAHTNDWLVEFATGEWQKFGDAAYQQLVWNPSKISKEY